MALMSRFLAAQRQNKIASYIKGDVLDLGCANARVLQTYGSNIDHYCGVERSSDRVDSLRKEFPEQSFIQCDLDNDSLDTQKKFDCVLMIALIEHLFNQKFVMDEVAKTLKPGGVVVITTPTPLGNDIVHRLGATIGLFAKSAVDDHIVIYNKHRFKILANEVGLSLKKHQYFQLFCNQLAILEKS